METEFIYWRHILPVGIKVEEITGREDKEGKVWRAMALQVYKENGRDGYRDVTHLESGAPMVVDSSDYRISVTHTGRLLAIATLPKTPEVNLEEFAPRAAMGIDAESKDRKQTVKVREKYLTEEEMAMVPEDDVLKNVVAWTVKEALYKAALDPGIDYREGLKILSLPDPENGTIGTAQLVRTDGNTYDMELYSYISDDQWCITVAYSPKCAKFAVGKKAK